MRHRGVGRLWLPVLAVAVVLVVWLRTTGTEAAFAVTTGNPANTFSANPDWKPPLISQATVVKSQGCVTGWVHAGGSYTVSANVADDPASNPASGLASVTGDFSPLGGSSSVALTGTAPTFASGSQTVGSGVAAGAYSLSVKASDRATPVNTSTVPLTVTVDNTPPAAATATPAVTTTNAGGAGGAGVPGPGDTITFKWTKTIDPCSIVPGWNGSTTQNVTVLIQNKNGNGSSDQVNIMDGTNGTTQLPLGTFMLGSTGYVKSGSVTFGKPGDAVLSTMTWSGNAITVTLGQVDTGGGTVQGVGTKTSGSWTPQSAAFDYAGNPSSTTPWSESTTTVKF